MIKRALSESGCPPHILDSLMENCHERRWPRGLSSLETRQNNRRIYDNYICRRIPGEWEESLKRQTSVPDLLKVLVSQASRRYWC